LRGGDPGRARQDYTKHKDVPGDLILISRKVPAEPAATGFDAWQPALLGMACLLGAVLLLRRPRRC
jgi:hypothetical protein